MLQKILLVVLLVSSQACLAAQEPAQQSARLSHYEMDVRLDAATKTVSGSQKITWRNTTAHAVSELRLHLYLNAFRDVDSTFMREAGSEFRSRWGLGEFADMSLDSIELEVGAGREALTQRFVSPDDDNDADRTVVAVSLPAPVAAGQSITLYTTFTSKLPKAYRRTGWLPGDGFFCMQWYPKLGVLEELEEKAVWNCHQFHANTEFFADFSVYDVKLTVPADFVVGATGGVPVEVKKSFDKTLTFHQDDVHDFAFVADPDFVVHKEKFSPVKAVNDKSGVASAVAKKMGVPVSSFDLPETQIILLLRPEHDTPTQVRRHMEAVRCGLEFFGLRYGSYPYGAITVVDPGVDIAGHGLGGGMEYPTLITCGTSLIPHPREMRPEGVTVHEFGHQYWYGMSGSNEFEESWLDEGLNTYSESRALTLHYGAKVKPVRVERYGVLPLATASLPLLPESGLWSAEALPLYRVLPRRAKSLLSQVRFEATVMPRSPLLELLAAQPTLTGFREARFEDGWNDRRRLMLVDDPDAMVRKGWEFMNSMTYRANSYQRPATVLNTMERMVGRDTWWTFLRRFHAKARFGHPTTADFTRMLGEECGAGAAEFFTLATSAEGVFDYGIESISPSDGRGDEKLITIRRFGAVRGDVRVRFRFAGRAEPVYRTFPATEDYPWLRFRFVADEAGKPYGDLLEVWVDPPTKEYEAVRGPVGDYLIDQNLLNNAWRARPDRAPALYRGLRSLLQTQSQFSFAGIIG